MYETPEKNSMNTSAFSPVRFNESPSHQKSIRNDSIGIRQRMKATAKTLVENQRKWNAAHRRGITLCKAIERCKSHAIKTLNDTNSSDQTLYPAELKSACDKMKVITTIFEDVCNSANESKRQINSFIKVGATNVFADSHLLFRTWDCDKLEYVVDKICNGYENEYKIKINVMENIAHSRSNDELMMHLAVWEYQMHVNAEFELMFKALTSEADIELDDKV